MKSILALSAASGTVRRVAALGVAALCAVAMASGSVAETFVPFTQGDYSYSEGYVTHEAAEESTYFSYPSLETYFTTMGMAPGKTTVQCTLWKNANNTIRPIKAVQCAIKAAKYVHVGAQELDRWVCTFMCSASVATRVSPEVSCPDGKKWVDNCDRRRVRITAEVTTKPQGTKGEGGAIPSDEDSKFYCQAWFDSYPDEAKESLFNKCRDEILNGNFAYEAQDGEGEGECVSGTTGTANDYDEEWSDLLEDSNDIMISFDDDGGYSTGLNTEEEPLL